MTNENNTRSKANAVFFSVIMVISMVAVGFAAAPAAAEPGQGSITFNDQTAESDEVTVSVGSDTDYNDPNNNASVAITYTNSSNNIILAGATNTSINNSVDSGTVTVSLGDTDAIPGTHTAHLLNSTQIAGLSAGDPLGTQAPASANTDDATVYAATGGERSPTSDVVNDGNSVFQGEEVTFVGNASQGQISASELSGTSGNREGTPLQNPIPDNQDTGTYDLNGPTNGDAGFSTTVVEPRINTGEVQIVGSGNDVSEVGPDSAGKLKIFAEWNFGNAENLSVTVEDPNGDDITGEVLTNDPDGNGQDVLSYGENETDSEDASVGFSLANEDAGEYTVIFEGNDDLDSGTTQEYTIELSNEDDLSIETAEDTVTEGTNIGYTVSGGTDGNERLVTIDESFYADGVSASGANPKEIFRNVQDVTGTGSEPGEFAYATVEIDGTTAIGSIDTQYLDTTDVTVEVYTDSTAPTSLSSSNLEDDDEFEVTEGSTTLNSPTGDYVVGSEVTVNGTAEAADDVRLYALNNNNWEVVNVDSGQADISVDSDDTFELEDVVFSANTGGGNDILSLPGRYSIGVIDADTAVSIEESPGEINTSAWTSNDGTRASINVEAGDLSGDFGIINGQFAVEDNSISVEGTASGQEDVVVAFVGERGSVDVTTVSVDNDGSFDDDDIDVSDLDQGAASGHIISVGRDSSAGDGSLPGGVSGSDASALENYIDELDNGTSLTGNQVRDRIVSETTEADATDDLMVSTTFRITEGSVSIDSVYPEAAQADGVNPVAAGETMVIEGSTNFQPDDNAVVINVLNQNSNSVDSTSVDEWENDGQFSVTLDTSDLETGTYTLEADTGDATDSVAIEIVEERQTADDGDDGADDGEDGGTDGEDGGTDGEDGMDGEDGEDGGTDGEDGGTDGEDGGTDGDDGGDGGTDDSTPGFGALVALVALIAAALLATRRDN